MQLQQISVIGFGKRPGQVVTPAAFAVTATKANSTAAPLPASARDNLDSPLSSSLINGSFIAFPFPSHEAGTSSSIRNLRPSWDTKAGTRSIRRRLTSTPLWS